MIALNHSRHALIIEDEMLIALEVESLLHDFGFESCDIVDNPAMRGVTMAKVSGPGEIGRRLDGIVIYLEDQAASRE